MFATISALLLIFGILSFHKQEMMKSQHQVLRVDPGRNINSRKMEHRPKHFLGFRHLGATVNSSGLKGPAMLFPWVVGTFHRLDSCLLTSLMDFRLSVLCASFFTSCETGHKQKERPDLPVNVVLGVLHGLLLECKKSMGLTIPSHCSYFICSIRECREKKALSESMHAGAQRKEWWSTSYSLSQLDT